MNQTSLSLLNQIRDSSDSEGWSRLVALYAPLLRDWLRRYDVQASDVDDLVQEVLVAVTKDLGKFEHAGRPGAFRSWLKTILVHRLRHFWRARNRIPDARGGAEIDARLDELDDPASQLTLLWNQEHDRVVLRRLLAIVEGHFSESTWRAFCRVALDGAKADVVAAELGMSLNAVFIAKSRVLSRLRQEADGLVESSFGFFSNR